jgi:hypothetical protein
MIGKMKNEKNWKSDEKKNHENIVSLERNEKFHERVREKRNPEMNENEKRSEKRSENEKNHENDSY